MNNKLNYLWKAQFNTTSQKAVRSAFIFAELVNFCSTALAGLHGDEIKQQGPAEVHPFVQTLAQIPCRTAEDVRTAQTSLRHAAQPLPTSSINSNVVREALNKASKQDQKLQKKYFALLCPSELESVYQQDSCAREIKLLSYYKMISTAFSATGNLDLLNRMKSDSSAALHEIHRYLETHCHPDYYSRVGFSMLVNILNNKAIKPDNSQNNWNKAAVLKSMYDKLDKDEYNRCNAADEALKYESSAEYAACAKYEASRQCGAKVAETPEEPAGYEGYIEYKKCLAYKRYEDMAGSLDDQYDLSEVLNFTVNYMVYGIGVNYVFPYVIGEYLKAILTEGKSPLNWFVDNFLTSIAGETSRYGDYIQQITNATNNCLGKTNTITNGNGAPYESCEDYIFQLETDGKCTLDNRVKAINFVEGIIKRNEEKIGDVRISGSRTADILSNLSNVVSFAIFGDERRSLAKFMDNTHSTLLNELRSVRASLTSGKLLSDHANDANNSTDPHHTSSSDTNRCPISGKHSKTPSTIEGYKKNLHEFEVNRQIIDEECQELGTRIDDSVLLLLATIVNTAHLNASGKSVQDALNDVKKALNSSTNIRNFIDRFQVGRLYNEVTNNAVVSNSVLQDAIDVVLNNELILHSFTDICSPKKEKRGIVAKCASMFSFWRIPLSLYNVARKLFISTKNYIVYYCRLRKGE